MPKVTLRFSLSSIRQAFEDVTGIKNPVIEEYYEAHNALKMIMKDVKFTQVDGKKQSPISDFVRISIETIEICADEACEVPLNSRNDSDESQFIPAIKKLQEIIK